jgi:hypothetical protein
VEAINKNLNHRQLTSDNEAHKQFLMQTLLKIRQLREKNPYMCLSREEKEIEERLGN